MREVPLYAPRIHRGHEKDKTSVRAVFFLVGTGKMWHPWTFVRRHHFIEAVSYKESIRLHALQQVQHHPWSHLKARLHKLAQRYPCNHANVTLGSHHQPPEVNYRGTSLIRKHLFLGSYGSPVLRALWWSYWGGRFLMSEVPLYLPRLEHGEIPQDVNAES